MARRSAAPTADHPAPERTDGARTGAGTAGFARNSMASLLRTASGAFLLLLVPPVLVRELSVPSYAAWAIAVEVSTYLGMLDVGALSAVGHFSAGLATDDRRGRGQVLSTVLTLQLLLGLVGAIGLTVFAVALPSIFPDMPAGVVGSGRVSVLLLAWLVAVLIRVATGSATVATITAAGIMAPIAQDLGTTEVSLLVLAIGAGSVFFSHVNDAGFWLVKEFFGLSVVQTIKSWSIMETILSVSGLIVVLALNQVI